MVIVIVIMIIILWAYNMQQDTYCKYCFFVMHNVQVDLWYWFMYKERKKIAELIQLRCIGIGTSQLSG